MLLPLALMAIGCRGGTKQSSSEANGQAAASSSTTAIPVDWAAVDGAMGRPGDVSPDGAHRYRFPRTDLKVSLDGTALQAGFALGSYAAFAEAHDGATVMGDLRYRSRRPPGSWQPSRASATSLPAALPSDGRLRDAQAAS